MTAMPAEAFGSSPALVRAEAEIREMGIPGAPEFTSWTQQEPCAQPEADPEAWHPKVGEVTEAQREAGVARRLCDQCPVLTKTECLSWALENPAEGVWGGTTARDRDGLRLQTGPTVLKVAAELARQRSASEAARRNALTLAGEPDRTGTQASA